jgi:predicted nucleic acid-binding protein
LRIYLDSCIVCRLFDDRSQLRVRQEAEAIEAVFRMFSEGSAVWVTSDALLDELQENPGQLLRAAGISLLSLSSEKAPIDSATEGRSEELEISGFTAYDALHLACAERAGVDILLTTDDRFERRAKRGVGAARISIQNPLNWLAGAGRGNP